MDAGEDVGQPSIVRAGLAAAWVVAAASCEESSDPPHPASREATRPVATSRVDGARRMRSMVGPVLVLGSVTVNATIGVLAVQGDVREHLRVLDALGVRTLTVRRTSELDACDGLVIPGGESTTMAKLARTFDLFEPIRQRVKDGMPAFGTCAGMIMLADRIEDGAADQETLGGLDITVRRNAFGRQVDSFEADLTVAGLDAAVHAIFIRAPWVEAVGPGVEVLR